MTSTDLIESVKRRISFPLSQNTFTEEDILHFANEEIANNLVPQILSYHEEFFVAYDLVTLVSTQTKYPIPKRAIGQRLRNMFYSDTGGNLFEMTRVDSDDKGFFQRNIGTDQTIHKFYLENDKVVLTPLSLVGTAGALRMEYFMRPNQLVTNDRAATSTYFVKRITVDNTSLVAGDILTVDGLTLVTDVDFAIGATSIITASNIVSAINASGLAIASNGATASNVVAVKTSLLSTVYTTTNATAFVIDALLGIEFLSLPTHFVSGIKLDFLQLEGSHKVLTKDITIGTILDTVIYFPVASIPTDMVIGDYVCQQYECIIPQLPDDLHSGIAQRVCSAILAAIGDMNGQAVSQAKVADMEKQQGRLLDNRVDGCSQKVLSRNSILRLNKNRFRRF
jgi:hypothetical protein